MHSDFTSKNIVVTGGTGAFGQKFIGFVKNLSPKSLTLFSRDEMKHAALKRTVGKLNFPLYFKIGDITRPEDLQEALGNSPDIVIHAAAMKHLPECEANPRVSTIVNVGGTENVIRAFRNSEAETLIFLSTDKAPYASSIYGAQKYIGEKLIHECASNLPAGKKAFSLRYSNVIDSTGAVFHIFADILQKAGTATVNGTQTIRGFVTQQEVLRCIEAGIKFARGGEVITLIPKVVRISELASSMQEILACGKVNIQEAVGFQGEKESATLIMAEEIYQAKNFPEAEVDVCILDFLGRHTDRKTMVFKHSGAFTLEHCPMLSGKELKDFLKVVMTQNKLIS